MQVVVEAHVEGLDGPKLESGDDIYDSVTRAYSVEDDDPVLVANMLVDAGATKSLACDTWFEPHDERGVAAMLEMIRT